MSACIRTWLIAALTHAKLTALAEWQFAELVDLASEEGVLVALEYRLQSHPDSSAVPIGLLAGIKAEAKHSLMEQLPFHAEQSKLFRALNAAQIRFLVMKGVALGNWLYDSPVLRPVADIDLWFVDNQAVYALSEILRPLGYEQAETAGGLSSFELAFDKQLNGWKIRIDAHWAMFNSAILSASVSYQAAYARAMPVTIQGQDVKVLGITDALINSIGHRTLKHLARQANTLKWLYDQYLLFNALNAAQWQELLDRCIEAGISDLALEAIEQSQKQFKTDISPQVVDSLVENARREKMKRGWFQSWTSYQWHEMLAVSPKYSERAVWLGQRLWPNPAAMRERYGSDVPVWKFMLRRIGTGLKRLFS